MSLLGLTLGTAGMAAALSARFNWWRPRVSGLPALMYHKIGVPPSGPALKNLWVSKCAFTTQLRYLLDRGYETMLFSELRDAEAGRIPMPARPLLITFDDGYADNFETALPVLRQMGMKANIFLVLEGMDRHNSWHDPNTEPWQRMLTWAQTAEMQSSGLVEFGSHTMRHACLTKLTLDEARWEIVESKKRLENRLDREILAFAYPYGAGAYDPAVRSLVREAGYRYDFGVRQGISPSPWEPGQGPLKRLLIRGDDTRLDFHLNVTRGRARF